jgi:Ca2+-binding RTX toxin-like protein
MAVFKAFQPYRLSQDPAWFGEVTQATGSRITIVDATRRIEYTGSFSYSNVSNAVFGTVTGLTQFNANGPLYSLTGARADALTIYQAIQIARDSVAAAREYLKFDDQATGSSGADELLGFNGNDRIDGAGGADDLFGGAGDDTLTGGTGNDVLSGDAGDDSLSGGDGSDALSGGAGRDRLTGGDGADTATYADAALRVAVSLDRSFAGRGDAEGDTFDSVENLIGSRGGDRLGGDRFANRIDGGAGSDALSGGRGGDRLSGGDGDDTIDGGAGADVLSGGAGRDRFVFRSPADSSATARDRIAGFEGAGAADGDRIVLEGIDANRNRDGDQDFVFGTATGIGRLYLGADGAGTVVFGNVDRDAAPELVILIVDGAVRKAAYTEADFVL